MKRLLFLAQEYRNFLSVTAKTDLVIRQRREDRTKSQISCAKESTKLTPQILNYQLQKRRTLSWERIQGYVGLNNKCGTRFGLLCPRLCHWRQTLIRRTKQNWSFTRVIASRSCVWYLNRPWYVKICRQNQTHYNLTLKILSPFSFQPRLTCDGLNQYGTRLGRFATGGQLWFETELKL